MKDIIKRARQELLTIQETGCKKIDYEKAYMEGYEDCFNFFCDEIDKITTKEEDK